MLQRRGRRFPYRPINRTRPVRATFTGAQPQEVQGATARIRFTGDSEVLRSAGRSVRGVFADLDASIGEFVEHSKTAPWGKAS